MMVDESIGQDCPISVIQQRDQYIGFFNSIVKNDKKQKVPSKVELFHHIHAPKEYQDLRSHNQSIILDGGCKYDDEITQGDPELDSDCCLDLKA